MLDVSVSPANSKSIHVVAQAETVSEQQGDANISHRLHHTISLRAKPDAP